MKGSLSLFSSTAISTATSPRTTSICLRAFATSRYFLQTPTGSGFTSAGSRTEFVGAELIQAYIAAKNERLGDYRKTASKVWLLIVNDLFLGAGEVCVHREKIAHCTFDFDFDKVLFFERQPGGSGKVVELRRGVSRAA